MIILLIQIVSIHPAEHPKQVPFCTWQTLSLQFVGQISLQLFPYTPDAWHPEWKRSGKTCDLSSYSVDLFFFLFFKHCAIFNAGPLVYVDVLCIPNPWQYWVCRSLPFFLSAWRYFWTFVKIELILNYKNTSLKIRHITVLYKYSKPHDSVQVFKKE